MYAKNVQKIIKLNNGGEIINLSWEILEHFEWKWGYRMRSMLNNYK